MMDPVQKRKQPALFIGHGSPMNTLERNSFTDVWRAIGVQLPRPRALLVVSAHWYIGATAVTAMPTPRMLRMEGALRNAISWWRIISSTKLSPWPPYSFGHVSPMNPAS